MIRTEIDNSFFEIKPESNAAFADLYSSSGRTTVVFLYAEFVSQVPKHSTASIDLNRFSYENGIAIKTRPS